MHKTKRDQIIIIITIIAVCQLDKGALHSGFQVTGTENHIKDEPIRTDVRLGGTCTVQGYLGESGAAGSWFQYILIAIFATAYYKYGHRIRYNLSVWDAMPDDIYLYIWIGKSVCWRR